MALVADSVNHLFAVSSHSHRHHTDNGDPPSTRSSSSNSAVTKTSEPMSAHPDSSRGYQESQQEDGAVTPSQTRQASDEPSPSKGTKRAIDATKSTEAMSSITGPKARLSMSGGAAPSPDRRAHTAPSSPQRVHIRDLAHVQSFSNDAPRNPNVQYEISSMPIENIIEMVAGLLTKITTTNDMQHEHLHRQMPSPENPGPISPQTSSVLSFHGKNVPSITILSYLNRINKYCPTSYEVFLSLLVYFDRMTEKVNAGPIQSLREQSQGLDTRASDMASPGVKATQEEASQTATPPASGGLETPDHPRPIPGTPHSRYQDSPVLASASDGDLNLSHFFVVDSFNIHRLVIAGVTCASKFFSDIFYTNSRYAKVGGLPLPELNHLELQFLLLNDFRLSVPVEELEAYGTMLIEFYAREVADQQRAQENE